MSAIEQLPEGNALNEPLRTPPPLVFAAPKTAHPMPARAVTDRRPLTQAAARRRTSWLRRLFAVIVLVVAIAGIGLTIKDSNIATERHTATPPVSTLLSPSALNPGLHRHHHGRHRPA